MELIRINAPTLFYELTREYFSRNEIANSLQAGILKAVRDGIYNDHYLAVIKDGMETLSALIATPPHPLIVSPSTPANVEIAELFLKDIFSSGKNISGFLCRKDFSGILMEKCSGLSHRPLKVFREERLHSLRVLDPHEPRADGFLRKAEPGDSPLLTDWAESFKSDIGEPDDREKSRDLVERKTNDGMLYIWDDGGPVSMASCARPTKNSITINLVYTPPEERQRGYAYEAVYAICGKMLSEYRYILIYTDLGNPVSNFIYSKVGFIPVHDLTHFIFKDA